jgi:UDP-glucose 4-epimerase
MTTLLSAENIVITGATGFIGRHLTSRLVAMGYCPTLLVRNWRNDELTARWGQCVSWLPLDLTDRQAVSNALLNLRPSVVFHLAGTRGQGAANAAVLCAQMNVCATVGLLAAAGSAEVKRIVIMGSAEEYGQQPVPFHEALPLRPTSPYGVSKAAATGFAQTMYQREGCPVVILRPFTAYGPGQPADMFIADAINSAVRNTPFKMSQGEQRRDLIYIEDVVDALTAAANMPGIEGRVINIGAGQAHKLRDVATLIWRLTATEAPLMIGARQNATDQFSDTWADITLASQLLGWEPRTSLMAGLQATIRHAVEELQAREHECLVA